MSHSTVVGSFHLKILLQVFVTSDALRMLGGGGGVVVKCRPLLLNLLLFWLTWQVKELNHVLEAEKSCRTDLEMYVAVLNTQKTVLQEDAEKMRKELHEGITVMWLHEA